MKRRSALFAAACGLLAACADGTPLESRPGTAPPPSAQRFECTAYVHEQRVTCTTARPAGLRGAFIGGQGQYVTLASSNVVFNAGTRTLSTDVTVQNLLSIAMGTLDGVNADPAGVRVFFYQGPTVTVGTGNVTVQNPDGVGTFTASNQPYFQYAGLAPGQTSAAKSWQFHLDADADQFTFSVFVATHTAPTIVITEIMAHPTTTSEPAGEWFEMYNASFDPIDLQGWTIASAGDTPHTITASLVVGPHGYVLVGGSTSTAANRGVPVQYAWTGISLGNANGDWLAVRSPAGFTADSVDWGAAPGETASLPPTGALRELDSPQNDNTYLSGASSHWFTTTHRHDRPPTLVATAPLMGTVARPSLRVDADCIDDHACQSLTLRVVSGNDPGTPGATLASGVSGIHADLSLAAYESSRMRLRLTATDSVNQSTSRDYEIFVESSAHLTEVVSAGDLLLDFDATRVLTGDQAFSLSATPTQVPWAVRSVDRGTGTATLLASGSRLDGSPNRYRGWLHTNGALFGSTGGIGIPTSTFDWVSGTLTSLAPVAMDEVDVEGDRAAYRLSQGNPYPVVLRDLAAGVSSPIAGVGAGPGPDEVDLAANGDVVFGTGADILRYRAGVVDSVTTNGSGAAGGTLYNQPVTDGTNVVYQAFASSTTHLILRTAADTVDLGIAASLSTGGTAAHRSYEVENGWTAFLKNDLDGVVQAWVRSPAGELRQATSSAQDVELRALGSGGELVFARGGRVLVAQYPYTAAPVDVFSDLLRNYGSIRWRGGQLFRFLGRTAFQVGY
jgi:hypothetical protein